MHRIKSHNGKVLVSVSKSLDFETHPSLGLKKVRKKVSSKSGSQDSKISSLRHNLGISLETVNPVSEITEYTHNFHLQIL